MSQTLTLDTEILVEAFSTAFTKLNPKHLAKNPVMFVVAIGSFITTIAFANDLVTKQWQEALFSGQISLWLWFTVLFANFAEAVAEGRGKVQAETLRKTRKDTQATLLLPNGEQKKISSAELNKDDEILVESHELIPADGTVIDGAAVVDEAAITGESAPVIREAGGDRSAVTGGTMVLDGSLRIRVTQEPGKSFLDKMIALVEGADRKKTPNEVALNILLSGLTIIFLLTVVTLKPIALYHHMVLSTVVLVALLVCLIPTTIGGLLSAIGIAGMDRLLQRNVLAMSGRAVEASGDIDVLLLDKTGTITLGNRMAAEFIPAPGVTESELGKAAYLASFFDKTPEGRSVVKLATEKNFHSKIGTDAHAVHFTAETRMSGTDDSGINFRKGSVEAIKAWLEGYGIPVSIEVKKTVDEIATQGGTPLIVATQEKIFGAIFLKDIVKPGIKDRFARIRAMGIRTIMITGDNRLTAAAIAAEAGVDDFLAEAKPEDKLQLIRTTKQGGHMVAMSGDGTNDAPALAQSDVGLVMNTGTQAAREAGNMIDLDSDPTKIIEIVEIGKQLLITRGSLTTFSIANDVAKYFAIIPAIFITTFPELSALNIMHLANPKSAILSAVIFNAMIIVLLIPLALTGVKYRPQSASKLLQHNLLVYGVGGIVAPFVGIKLIDILIKSLGLA